MKHSSLWMIFEKVAFPYGIQTKKLYGCKLVKAAKRSEKMQQVVQKESHEAL